MEYLLTFVEGIASFISPCVLPMLPMYISYFGAENKSVKKATINSIGFVAGFTIVFVLLGIFTSTLGKVINEYSKYINIVIGVIIILFGLQYVGIIKLNFLNKTKGIKNKPIELNILKAILFGMMFSITWTPCIGIFLSSALLMATTYGSVLKGVILLLTYSIGLRNSIYTNSSVFRKIKNNI